MPPHRRMPGGGAQRPVRSALRCRWEIAGLPLTEQKILLGRYTHGRRRDQRWCAPNADRAGRSATSRAGGVSVADELRINERLSISTGRDRAAGQPSSGPGWPARQRHCIAGRSGLDVEASGRCRRGSTRVACWPVPAPPSPQSPGRPRPVSQPRASVQRLAQKARHGAVGTAPPPPDAADTRFAPASSRPERRLGERKARRLCS